MNSHDLLEIYKNIENIIELLEDNNADKSLIEVIESLSELLDEHYD